MFALYCVLKADKYRQTIRQSNTDVGHTDGLNDKHFPTPRTPGSFVLFTHSLPSTFYMVSCK